MIVASKPGINPTDSKALVPVDVKTDGGKVVVHRADGKDGVFKKPLPPTPRLALQQKALDEDTYVTGIQKIVERDYFPELPYLRAKQQLEDAIQSRDPLRIKEAHLELRKAAATPGGGSLATPGRFPTGRTSVAASPMGSRMSTPGSAKGSRASVHGDGEDLEVDEVDKVTAGKSLDKFLHKYTSEDNQSASEIMLKDAVDLEWNRRWVHEQAAEYNNRQKLLIENGPRQSEGTLNMLISAPYDEKESLMHMVPQTQYKEKETEQQARRPPKEISNAATRVGRAFLDAQQKVLEHAQSVDGPKHVANTPAESPAVGGYRFMLTPSPAPGVDDDQPMFTWGSVEGTPLLLPEDDCPQIKPFEMQKPTSKEEIATSLHKKQIEKKAMAVKKGVESRRPWTGGMARPGTPGTPRLSQAAIKLAGKLHQGKSSGMGLDKQLRASYRGTPVSSKNHTPAGTPSKVSAPTTPRMSAPPSAAQSPAIRARGDPDRASGSGGSAGKKGGITDGLLRI